MSVTPSPIAGFAGQFFDNNGQPLSGGKIFTYAAGTTLPQATFTSASGTTPHANPIILDSAGRVPGGEIWLTDGLVYKFVIETATNVLIGTFDNITGVNSNFVNYTVQEEVITATAGQTVFNLSTITYTPGTNSLSVFIDGVNQYVGDSYLETDGTTVTFTAGLHVGAEVKFTTAIQTTTGAVDASIVSYDPPFANSVPTNVEAKLSEYVSVKDFGAVGDGVADDTAAIQAAVDALTEGGQLFFPPGKYKLTDEITLPSVGALTLQGSGGVDFIRGSPVPSGSGTYLFQTASNKAIFVFSPGCSYSSIKDMSFSPSLVPTSTPELTGKVGIKIDGDLPNVIWSLNFERLFFYNLEFGIVARDITSGSTSQDYSVAPTSVRQCFFVECFNGVYIDTNNADMWSYEQSFFFVAATAGSNGVYLRRFGLQHFNNCSSGSTAISTNRFVNIEGAGLNSVDKILFTNCQCETLTQFVNVQTGGGYVDPFDIEMHSCVAELGTDVYLGGRVNFISINSRYSSANINVDSVNVKLTTINDTFAASDFYFLSGTADGSFQNTIWGQSPSAIYGNRRYEDGVLVKLTGTEVGVISGVATNLVQLPVTAGLYEVYAYLANAGAGSLYMASARVGADGGEVALIGGENGANMSISVSGNFVQASQTSGVNQTVSWAFRKLT
jgi:hypothetical protein